MASSIGRRGLLASVLALSAARVLGANGKIRLGVIGTGGRGRNLMGRASASGGIQWMAVCDAYGAQRDKAAAVAGTPVEKLGDYRRVLDRNDLDAAIIAIWDSMRCQIAVDARAAGMEQRPEGLDWEACQWNTKKVSWNPKRYFNQYVSRDYSTNAQMDGLFVHLVDAVHWYLKVEKPLAADCFGGIHLPAEDRDTADTINSIVEYPGKLLATFEANVIDVAPREDVDIMLVGTGGRLSIFRNGYRFLSTEGKGKN